MKALEYRLAADLPPYWREAFLRVGACIRSMGRARMSYRPCTFEGRLAFIKAETAIAADSLAI